MNGNRHGFSLVEVCIAIGIVVFVVVALIGLLSIGLSSGKDSAEDMRLASMADYVMAQVRAAPFSAMVSATDYYFDYQGSPASTGSGAYYHCHVATAALSGTLALTGSNLLGVTARFNTVNGPATEQPGSTFFFERAND